MATRAPRFTQNISVGEPIEAVSLPHNIEAEQALLGALLIDNELLHEVKPPLSAAHFFEDVHGRIFTQICHLIEVQRSRATPITLKPFFARDEALTSLGGLSYLAHLTENPALIGARDFARQIVDLAQLRELIRVGRTMVEQAIDTGSAVAPDRQIEQAESALAAVADTGEAQRNASSFADAAAVAVGMVERARKAGGALSGITTGLTGLNSWLGGLHPSDLVILAGRPGMGKTALATNIAFAAAYRWQRDMVDGVAAQDSVGAPTAIFSLEMSSDQLAARILAEQSGLSSEKMRKGEIDQGEFLRLSRAAGDLHSLPLYIDDTPALTIAGLRSRARRLVRKYDIGLIVVDYVQLLQGDATGRGSENRVQEISEITRGLKGIAKEFKLPVLALSQLSRAVEAREDKRPQLADLRESGSIEQDADIVMFVFREEYYHAQKKPEDGSEKFDKWVAQGERIRGKAEVMVAKQRHGATGIVPLNFHKETTKFSDPIDGARLPERR